ncbi:hypothetical protein VTH82DRAFT_1429 [Thermothelomyces myriococcoides]
MVVSPKPCPALKPSSLSYHSVSVCFNNAKHEGDASASSRLLAVRALPSPRCHSQAVVILHDTATRPPPTSQRIRHLLDLVETAVPDPRVQLLAHGFSHLS